MKKLNEKVKKNIENFFDWIKGAELIELNSCNINEDPVRPELDLKFRTSFGRKIYGVKYKKEICAIMCFGFTNEIPKTIKELDLMTRDAHLQSTMRDQNVGKIAIAYTVWSKKKGGGKLIVNEVFKEIKKTNHLNRLVTLSPLSDMARNFHLRNGAFVNFLGKQDGLVHISELASKRVAKVGDVVKEGDEVSVKVVGFDRGKVKLSIKQAVA